MKINVWKGSEGPARRTQKATRSSHTYMGSNARSFLGTRRDLPTSFFPWMLALVMMGDFQMVWQQAQNYNKTKMWPEKGSECPSCEKSRRMFRAYTEIKPYFDPGLNLITRREGSTGCCISNTCFIPPCLLWPGFSSVCVLIPAPMRSLSISSVPEAQEALVRQHFESKCRGQGNVAQPLLQGTRCILLR